MRPIRLLVADSQPLSRLGLQAMLQQNSAHRIQIVGEVADGEQAVVETARLIPDVVLVDAQLPGIDTLEISRQILRMLPKTRILVLGAHCSRPLIVQLTHAGISGIVTRKVAPSELFRALQKVAEGGHYFCEESLISMAEAAGTGEAVAQTVMTTISAPRILTKREFEILRLVAEEKSNQEIARMLYLSPRTVETHKRNMLLKLKIKNVAGLVKYYLQRERNALTA